MQQTYYQVKILRFFSTHLDVGTLVTKEGTLHLRDLCEQCFLLDKKNTNLFSRAHHILSALFSTLYPGFDFASITAALSKKEQKAFYTSLCNHIFSCSFPLCHLKSKEALSAFLYQELAACASTKTLSRLWQRFSFYEKLFHIAFCFCFYREGSFFLLEQARNDSEFEALLTLLERGVLQPQRLYTWVQTNPSCSVEELEHFLQEYDKEIFKKAVLLKKALQQHAPAMLALTDVDFYQFVLFFGLYDHQVPVSDIGCSLEEKVQFCLEMTHNVGHEFLQGIVQHVTSFFYAKERYIQGIQSIVMAVPTVGKLLERFAYVPTLARAYRHFCDTCAVTCKNPLFIFDQSEPALFAKNRRFIKKISKRYKMPMVHLSKKQIIDLAKKLHIESLIVTGPNDFFGFAGARNAVMLLAPLLHVALQENLAFEEVLTLANSQLSKLFSQAVLSKEAPFIQMGDDDLLCDINLFFCDAYTAYANKETYFYRPGYLKGRITTECVATLDLQALLRQPQAYFTPLPWDDTPMQPAMPGMLSKPKLCLNVSFGHEESYVQLAVQKVMDFRRPALHLAGPRFYSKNIPKNRFSGLAATISAYIQYVFELVQIQELLDCTNVYNRSVLYWNSYKDTFTCLQDVIQTICQDAIFTKVQEQFWKNLKTYCERSLQHLDALIALPIEQTVRDFYKEAPWAKSFKKEIGKLKRVFLRLQQEALWYKLFAAHLLQDKNLKGAQQKVEEISQKPIGQHLFTQSLYVLCRVLGEGEFQKTLAYHQPM